MRRTALPLAAAIVCLVALAFTAAPAEAQTASFLGSTLSFSRNGDFNGSASTCPGGANPTQYRWSFPDEGVIRFGNPVTHKFSSSFCASTIELRITCPGGATATRTRFACWGCCVPGGIIPDSGYN